MLNGDHFFIRNDLTFKNRARSHTSKSKEIVAFTKTIVGGK